MLKNLISFRQRDGKKLKMTTHFNNLLAIEKKKYGCKVVIIETANKKRYKILKASDSYDELKEILKTNGIGFYESKAKSINVVTRESTMIGTK